MKTYFEKKDKIGRIRKETAELKETIIPKRSSRPASPLIVDPQVQRV